MKAGVDVPEETLDKAIRYVRSCHAAKEGFFRYQPQGSKGMSSFNLTGAALSALTVAKAGEDEAWKGGLAYLKATQGANTGRDKPHYYYYGQFYAARAMQRIGGKDWRTWYPVIRDALLLPPAAQSNG